MFYCADSSAAASDSLVYTAALPVSKAHCASQSTAKLISHTRSVKLTPHRLKPTKSVNNKKERKNSFISTANKKSAILFTRRNSNSPLTATACVVCNADLWRPPAITRPRLGAGLLLTKGPAFICSSQCVRWLNVECIVMVLIKFCFEWTVIYPKLGCLIKQSSQLI